MLEIVAQENPDLHVVSMHPGVGTLLEGALRTQFCLSLYLSGV